MDKIHSIFTPEVRSWLYGIGTFATPLLMIYGVIDDRQAVAWLGLAGAVLNQGMALINVPTKKRLARQEVAGQE